MKNTQRLKIRNKDEKSRRRGRPRKLLTGKRGRPRKAYNIKTDEDETKEDSSLEYPNAKDSDDEIFEGFLVSGNDPESIEEAITSPQRKEWEEAILNELNAHKKNKTWEIVERPNNVNVVGCKWVFTTKYDEYGKVKKRKAKGFTQTPGIDFNETYAQVARQRSIRVLIAIAVKLKLHLHQLDVVTAYLNGNLEESLYMEIPEYYDQLKNKNISNKTHACKLKKAIYGLKQSGRIWYMTLDSQLQKLGFSQLKNEPCLYVYKEDKNSMLIAIYVDDIIIASNNEEKANWIKQQLASNFDIKHIGKLKYFLGIEFHTIEDGIVLTQRKYITLLIEKFQMKDCNPVNTIMNISEKLFKEMCPLTKEEKEEMKYLPYQNLIGSLLYLAVTSRPDIAFAVSKLSQFNINPGKSHWIAAKRVLRYLKQTSNLGLYFRSTPDDIKGFVDANWASNVDDRKSFTGYFFKLSNSALSWEVKKQQTVALSSAEAEYMALAEASKEAIYLANLIEEIHPRKNAPIVLFNENQSAQIMAKSETFNNRSKHIGRY